MDACPSIAFNQQISVVMHERTGHTWRLCQEHTRYYVVPHHPNPIPTYKSQQEVNVGAKCGAKGGEMHVVRAAHP